MNISSLIKQYEKAIEELNKSESLNYSEYGCLWQTRNTLKTLQKEQREWCEKADERMIQEDSRPEPYDIIEAFGLEEE